MTTANADCISSHILGTCKPQFMPSTLPKACFSPDSCHWQGVVARRHPESSGEAPAACCKRYWVGRKLAGFSQPEERVHGGILITVELVKGLARLGFGEPHLHHLLELHRRTRHG